MSPEPSDHLRAHFKWFVILSFLIFTIFLNNSVIGAEKHWIVEKSDDGSIILLEDGSVWHVDPTDRIDSMLWLPMEDIIIPDSYDSLINIDTNEKVDAVRIR